jgi:hypothetical protein
MRGAKNTAKEKGGSPETTAFSCSKPIGSGSRCDFLALRARAPGPPARRLGCRICRADGIDGDGRRKHVERDALFAPGRFALFRALAADALAARAALAIHLRLLETLFAAAILALRTHRALLAAAVVALGAGGAIVTAAFVTLGTGGAIVTAAILAHGTGLAVVAAAAVAGPAVHPLLAPALVAALIGFLVGAVLGIGAFGAHRLVAILVLVRHEVVAARALLFEAAAIFIEHAEIMIRELEIIFGLHAIAGELGVARKRFILLEKLGRIAALPVVLAIALVRHIVRRALAAATAATAAVLTIVDQTLVLVTGGLFWPLHRPGPSRPQN